MKRPQFISTTVGYALISAAAWLVGAAVAFSPTPVRSSMTAASTSSFTFSACPQLQFHFSNSNTPSSRSRSIIPTSNQRRQFQLKSSLKETSEKETSYNETVEEQPQSQLHQQVSSALGDTTSAAMATEGGGEETLTSNDSPQQQLQEVLSSPELLDPAAILDATIGISEESGGAGDAIAVAVTPVTPSVTPMSTEAAKSKEEDLELTLQAILKHIEQTSSASDDVVDDELDEDGEGTFLVEDISASTDTKKLNETLMEQSQSSAIPIDQSTEALSETTPSILDSTPSITKILRYTIPAIGIWLCSPVLSMIDTAAVGLLSGTAQQAALNPAVSVTDYGALVVAFMYTATTNLIAAAVQEDKDNNQAVEQPKTTTTLITALKLALAVGSVFGVILGVSGKQLLKLLIGNDSLDPTVFAAALRYVQIRSLGMPAMVVIGTAQSACLGMQDVKSPLYVLAAAAVVNFLGDVLLVPKAGSAMFGGAAGAAWATVASQYAALLFFARWLTTSVNNNASEGEKRNCAIFAKFRKNVASDESDSGLGTTTSANIVNVTQGIMELTGTSKAGRSRRKQFRKFLTSSKLSKRISRAGIFPAVMSVDTTNSSIDDKNVIRPVVSEEKKKNELPKTRGFLANGKLSLRNYLSFSRDNFNLSKAKEFLPFVVPVTTTSVGRISGYIAMSHVASSTLGTYEMAGHQIIFSIFCCLTPFVDALSQVAQSFVPAIFEAKEKSKERSLALRKTINNFRKVGVGFGGLLVSLVACIPLISRYFTTDPLVFESVNNAIPGVGLFLFLHGLMCAGEGTMLGQKDLKFLRNMYAIYFFTVPAYMLRLKHRALNGIQTVGIGTMWTAFAMYNLIRTSTWHLRLAQLQRRTDRGVTTKDR